MAARLPAQPAGEFAELIDDTVRYAATDRWRSKPPALRELGVRCAANDATNS